MLRAQWCHFNLVAASGGWGIAQQSRLTTIFPSSGEPGLELGQEPDTPLSLCWNLSASYAGIVSPLMGEHQEESEIAAEFWGHPGGHCDNGIPLSAPAPAPDGAEKAEKMMCY